MTWVLRSCCTEICSSDCVLFHRTDGEMSEAVAGLYLITFKYLVEGKKNVCAPLAVKILPDNRSTKGTQLGFF